MSRATRAEINLSALKHNLQVAREQTQSKQIAIVKANAYGHGLVEIARALTDADGFGVATIDEAISLRESGVYKPIVLLQGFNELTDLVLIHAYKLQPAIHNQQQLEIIEQHAKHPLTVWLKIDTGMHRLGFHPDEASDIYKRLNECEPVQTPVHLMTHLACADDKDSAYTQQQLSMFTDTLQQLGDLIEHAQISIANSAGILGWKDSHTQWTRPGIMLYGSSPFANDVAEQQNLKPVMTLKSEVIAINEFKKGDSIGYGQAYVCEKNMTIATVAIGYGDGYPRHAKNGTPVLVNGKRVSLVGRVSMDMITVDISDLKKVKLGDEVILWGQGLPAEEVARDAETISYELFCNVTQRVKFLYSE